MPMYKNTHNIKKAFIDATLSGSSRLVQFLASRDEIEGKGQLGEEGERGAVFLQLFVEREEFAVSHLQSSLFLIRYPNIVLYRNDHTFKN